jgi:hypothetical protein
MTWYFTQLEFVETVCGHPPLYVFWAMQISPFKMCLFCLEDEL